MPYVGLTLWSPGFGGGGGGGFGAGSLGVGVVLRLPAQGLMESTAEAQVDFSAFLSPGVDAMVLAGPDCHPATGLLGDQILVYSRRNDFSASRLARERSRLDRGANVKTAV